MKMRGFFISSNQDGQVKPMIFKAMLSLIIATLFHSMFANLSGRNIVESVADTIGKYHKECDTITAAYTICLKNMCPIISLPPACIEMNLIYYDF